MSLFKAIFRRDQSVFREITERVNAATEDNIRASRRLIEAIDVAGGLRRREEQNSRDLINAISHKQRRFKGGLL